MASVTQNRGEFVYITEAMTPVNSEVFPHSCSLLSFWTLGKSYLQYLYSLVPSTSFIGFQYIFIKQGSLSLFTTIITSHPYR